MEAIGNWGVIGASVLQNPLGEFLTCLGVDGVAGVVVDDAREGEE